MVQPMGSEPIKGQMPLPQSDKPQTEQQQKNNIPFEQQPSMFNFGTKNLSQIPDNRKNPNMLTDGFATSGPMTNEQITNSMFSLLNANDIQDPHHVSYNEVEKQITAMYIKYANEGQTPAGYNNLTDMLSDLKTQYEKADINGDGKLNIDEFSTLMENTYQFDPSLGWNENTAINEKTDITNNKIE